MAAVGIALAGIAAAGLLDSPPPNWALVTLAIASVVMALAIAFLVPVRYRRAALIYSAFVAMFVLLVVAAFWR